MRCMRYVAATPAYMLVTLCVVTEYVFPIGGLVVILTLSENSLE